MSGHQLNETLGILLAATHKCDWLCFWPLVVATARGQGPCSLSTYCVLSLLFVSPRSSPGTWALYHRYVTDRRLGVRAATCVVELRSQTPFGPVLNPGP